MEVSDSVKTMNAHQKRKLAILWHEKDRHRQLNYAIEYLVDIWRREGHQVTYVFGTKEYIPADLALLHVDLSVVPDEYIEFGRRYPILLNGRIKDIRKSSFSQHLLRHGDSYDGPIIVKPDLNYGGRPEEEQNRSAVRKLYAKYIPLKARQCVSEHILKRFRAPTEKGSSFEYPVFDRLEDVPIDFFEDPGMVVEKFLPEREGDRYYTRSYLFLGDRGQTIRVASKDPIVKVGDEVEVIETDSEILSIRHKMGFDYGKFDYVVHKGKVVLLDINKTIGITRGMSGAEDRIIDRAAGLYSYFR